jgi:ubiquinone/menaquinone biosynthesis C-methylase UbiE/uncharacterized protein YbaR (Trm112 family)
LDELIELLRCTQCQSKVELRDGSAPAQIDWPLLDKHLSCVSCGEQYPITDDNIPILWDDDIKAIIAHSSTVGLEVMSANFEIYESISDNYDEHSRNSPLLPMKLRNAAERVLASTGSPKLHLDFCCGPGQVIGWMKSFGLKQVGLDLSITNLRNARRHTGCMVVCANACNMPFEAGTFDIVTESSALHHIPDWRKALLEAIRVCKSPGGTIIDAEPTKEQMAISKLAILVFNSRFITYKMLSYFKRDKYVFRNIKQAKLNAKAEIHHQPGTGFPVEELKSIFIDSGHDVQVVLSPSATLTEEPKPNWKEVLLSLLSLRNPWAAEYGNFTSISISRPDAGGQNRP